MTPSKNDPIPAWLLSPPVPITIAPSWCIGAYPLGSGPSYHFDSTPDVESPPLRANVVCPLFFSSAVTNGVLFPRLAGFEPLPMYWPFSRSAWTHGPLPVHGGNRHAVVRLTASMCEAPLSLPLVSTLPKSKQQPALTWVPLATMYMPSGWPLTAIPRVLLFRYPVPGVTNTPYAL